MIRALFITVVVVCCAGVTRAAPQTEPVKDSPKDALLAQDAAAKSGDIDADVACYQADDDEQKKLARAIAQGDVALAKLEKAVEKEFGKDLAGQVVRAAGSETVSAVSEASAEASGDHATVHFSDSNSSVPMVRAEGKWKISLGDWVKDAKPGQVEHLISSVDDLAAGLDHLADLVEHEKFRSGEGVRDRVEALHNQLFGGHS